MSVLNAKCVPFCLYTLSKLAFLVIGGMKSKVNRVSVSPDKFRKTAKVRLVIYLEQPVKLVYHPVCKGVKSRL